MSRNKHCSHLPFAYYCFPVLILTFIGLGNSAYLATAHYRNYTDLTYQSFCALSTAINCDTVAQSPWSILLGLPLAVWGITAYLLFLILLIPAKKEGQGIPFWSLLFCLALLFSFTSLGFGAISAFKIHSYCILCILSYAVSFALLFYTWIIRRRFSTSPLFKEMRLAGHSLLANKWLASVLLAFAICFSSLFLCFPQYWHYTLPLPSSIIKTGTTEKGHPWIGAEHPKLTIEEFSDYMCFQCSKTHFLLRQLIAQHPDSIRLVHHHYPIDHEFNPLVAPEPFHVGSGKMALLAIYAMTENKFWEMNDLLFKLGRSRTSLNTKILAEQLKLPHTGLVNALSDPHFRLLLRNDIRLGGMNGITGTPSFQINGKIYQGSIPPHLLKEEL